MNDKKKTRRGALVFVLVLTLSFGLSGCDSGDTGSDISGPGGQGPGGPGGNVPGNSLVLPSGYGWWSIPGAGEDNLLAVFSANGTLMFYELLFCCNTWEVEHFLFWSVIGNTLRVSEAGWTDIWNFHHPSPNELVLMNVDWDGPWRLVRRDIASLGGRWDVVCRCWW